MIDWLLYALGAFFMVNGVPHFVQGISGNPFQSPFAKPAGVGESSPLVNVLWGAFNFFAGTVILYHYLHFQPGANRQTLFVAVVALLCSMVLAVYFGGVRNSDKNSSAKKADRE